MAEAYVSTIAARLGRPRSTIYREIKRNRFEDDELPELNGYFGLLAKKTASQPRQVVSEHVVEFGTAPTV